MNLMYETPLDRDVAHDCQRRFHIVTREARMSGNAE
jgi:hypothetical protein